MKKVNSLTGLRFLMCMMIVISHFEFLGDYIINTSGGYVSLYNLLFHNASMAVIFFFVMSGFGLTYRAYSKNDYVSANKITLRNCFSFTWHRIKKIYFIYLVSMAVMIPYCICSSIYDGKSIGISMIYTVVKIIIAPTLLQSAVGVHSFTNILNGACWFLSALTILYFIYPVLEKINVKWILNKGKAKIWLIVVLVLRIIIQCIFSWIAEITIFDELDYASPYLRIFDFVLGILIFDVLIEERNKSADKVKWINTYTEVLAIVLVIGWWLGRNCIFYDEYELIKCAVDIILVCFLVYVFAHENGKISKVLGGKQFVALGNLTMYFYIWHYPIRVNLHYLLGKIIQNTILCDALTIAGIVAFTILLTFICLRMQKIYNKRWQERKI